MFTRNLSSQRGATLVVSLVLLLALTVVGIASMRESVVQQKVISALMEDDTAFQAAEYALRQGEQFVLSQALENPDALLQGTATVGAVTFKVYSALQSELDDFWWKDPDAEEWEDGIAVDDYPTFSDVNRGEPPTAPRYVIELLGKDTVGGGSAELGNSDEHGVTNYRITARGFGANDLNYVVLQSTVAVQQ